MLAEAFEKDAAARGIEMNKVLDKGLSLSVLYAQLEQLFPEDFPF